MRDKKTEIKRLGINLVGVVVASLLQILVFTTSSYSETQISKTTKFCPINTSYEKFAHILEDIRNFTEKANSNYKEESNKWQSVIEYVTLGNPKIRITIDKEFNLPSLNQGPEIANDIFYYYETYPDERPISKIELRLTDNFRELTVSGYDKIQVNALVSLAVDDFDELGCSFGGSPQRLLAYAILFIITLVIFIFSMVFFVKNDKTFKIIWIIFVLCWLIIMLALPMDSWFPGTTVRAGPISFLARHPEFLGILGLIVTVVYPLLGYIIKKRFKRSASGSS